MSELPNFLLKLFDGGRVVPRIVERPSAFKQLPSSAYQTAFYVKMAMAPTIISSIPRAMRKAPTGIAKGQARSANTPKNIRTATKGSSSRPNKIAIKSKRSFLIAANSNPSAKVSEAYTGGLAVAEQRAAPAVLNSDQRKKPLTYPLNPLV
jgi:hypothetical protein